MVREEDPERRIVGRKDQANKSIGRMPRYQEPMKDVTSCEKLRGGANSQGALDIRMRELTCSRRTGIIT